MGSTFGRSSYGPLPSTHWPDVMGNPLAPSKAAWRAAGPRPVRSRRVCNRFRKRRPAAKNRCTHLCPVSRQMPYVRPSPARSRRPRASQSSMNRLRFSTGPVSFQGTLEVSPIRPDHTRRVPASFECPVTPLPACGKAAASLPGGTCLGRRRESKRSCPSPTDPQPWLRLRPTPTMPACPRTPVGTLPWGYGRDILKAIPSLRSDRSPSIGTVFTFAGIRRKRYTLGPSMNSTENRLAGSSTCRSESL